tara:strand:- start:520 stop:699 length:180 start_codon:yes stop_codon:yes gene_type:complete
MNSTGANQRLLSPTHIAKAFGFVFSFFSAQSKIQKILGSSQKYTNLTFKPETRIVYRLC